MTGEHEAPWMPDVGEGTPTVVLINPQGTRHLAFENGHWYRLWQNRAPALLHAGEAIFLRPSDAATVVRVSATWVMQHPDADRRHDLIDEIAVAVAELARRVATQ